MNSPNLLFIFSDQQHWRAVGYRDHFFDTPAQDTLAKDGIVFNNAFCTTPQCSPSRSSMLTGFYPSKTGVWGNIGKAGGRNLQQKNIGKILQQNSYYTGYFGKWHLGNDEIGTAGWDERLFIRQDTITMKKAIKFLKNQKKNGDKPFALFVSLNNPHNIYNYISNKFRIKAKIVDLPETWNKQIFENRPKCHKEFMTNDQGKIIYQNDEKEWIRYHDHYQKKNRKYDEKVGKIIKQMKKLGLYDNTNIIVTSDHGDMDTNHGLIYKGPFMYEHMVRIPLIIKPVGLANASSDFLTINTDLVPTILDLCSISPIKTDGISLKPIIYGDEIKSEREFVIGQYYSKQKWVNPIRMIRTNEWKYNLYIIENNPQQFFEELYNLKEDPQELNNLASIHAYDGIKERFRTQLDGWIDKNDDPFYSQKKTDREGNPI